MEKLIEWVNSLPKPVKIILALCVGGLMCYGVVYLTFGDKMKPAPVVQEKSVLLNVQDPTHEVVNDSEMRKYEMSGVEETAESYWDRLGAKGGGDSGIPVASGQSTTTTTPVPGAPPVDRSKYSSLELYLIESGIKTPAQIDAEREKQERELREMQEREAQSMPKTYTPEQQDSMMIERFDKAYSLAMKYQQPQQAPETTPKKEVEEPQPRRLNFDGSNAQHIPEESYAEDDICSSLDGSLENSLTYSKGNVTVRPARATFIKSERIVAGQRVIMRLMEDLQLSNGNIIPANTHVSGICAMGRRLEIKVSTLQFGGKIYNIALSIYDNDGTEGIYCPVIEQKKKTAAKNIATTAASDAASIAGSAFGYLGNVAGNLASTTINELSRMTLRDGSVAINVVAGYQFYIFEDIEELEKQNRNNQ